MENGLVAERSSSTDLEYRKAKEHRDDAREVAELSS